VLHAIVEETPELLRWSLEALRAVVASNWPEPNEAAASGGTEPVPPPPQYGVGDDAFMLRYLRCAKFSVPKAAKFYRNYCEKRLLYFGPDTGKLRFVDYGLEATARLGVINVVTPRRYDKWGRVVLAYVFRNVDYDVTDPLKLCQMVWIVVDRLLEDEHVQR
jgi:hypothetical protein